MKALLISSPGDFGSLEPHWADDPLFLPLPGGSIIDLHEASFLRLGIRQARMLRCHQPGQIPKLDRLEARLKGRAIDWSVRNWPVGPWPSGFTLSEVLLRQGLFLEGDEAIVFWTAAPDPRGWTGPIIPSGFPSVEGPKWKTRVWQSGGKLQTWDGPQISLAGTRDFYRSSIRFLETLPPPPLGLKGISRQAVLEPPLALGPSVRAAAHSHLGPLVQLAAGSRVEPGTSLLRTLVLTPTRFSKDCSFADKIVIGDYVVEPLHGDETPLRMC